MGTQLKDGENEGDWNISTELLAPVGGEKALESFVFMTSFATLPPATGEAELVSDKSGPRGNFHSL